MASIKKHRSGREFEILGEILIIPASDSKADESAATTMQATAIPIYFRIEFSRALAACLQGPTVGYTEPR